MSPATDKKKREPVRKNPKKEVKIVNRLRKNCKLKQCKYCVYE